MVTTVAAADDVFDAVSAMVLVLPVQAKKQDSVDEQPWDPCGNETIQCTGRPGTPRGNKAKLPFPDNCTQYLLCIGNSPLRLMDCPAGQFFNNVTRSCSNASDNCQSPCPFGIYLTQMSTGDESKSTRSPPSPDFTKKGDAEITRAQMMDKINTTVAGSGQSVTTTVQPGMVSTGSTLQSSRASQTAKTTTESPPADVMSGMLT